MGIVTMAVIVAVAVLAIVVFAVGSAMRLMVRVLSVRRVLRMVNFPCG